MANIGTYSSVIESLTAKLQSRIGQLLQMREILVKIKNETKLLTTGSQVDNLLTEQSRLEQQISVVQAVGAKMKAEGVTFAGSAQIGAFIANMEQQIKNVNKLLKQHQQEIGLTTIPLFGEWLTAQNMAIGLVVLMGGYYLLKRR